MPHLPSKSWTEMSRKGYKIDPMVCPKCGGKMKVAAFITDYLAVNQITDHLKLIFVARKSPPSHVIGHVFLKAAEERKEYF